MAILLDSLVLKWWATTATDRNLRYVSSTSTFSGNITTLPCFLGGLPPSLVAFLIGQSQGVQNYRRHGEKYVSIARDHLFLWYTIYWRDRRLTRRWSAWHSILSRYSQHLGSPQKHQGWPWNCYNGHMVNFLQICFNTTSWCLHFSQLQMAPCTLCKFW